MEGSKYFPFEIKDLEAKLNEELMSFFTGQNSGFVRVGTKGYLLPSKYREAGPQIYNLPLRSSDTIIVTFPRSGTTWIQELVWLVVNDLDYTTAKEVGLVRRFPFVEHHIYFDSKTVTKLKEDKSDEQAKVIDNMTSSKIEDVSAAPSPRFLKFHLPLSLLPPSLLDTTKVVYVARDPRDVVISYYRHNRLIKLHGFVGDFKKYWSYCLRDLLYYTPYFEHIKEAWGKRDHPNMLFLFYEDLCKDLPSSLRRIAKFFDKQYTDEQYAKLSEHLSFHNLKSNKSVNFDASEKLGMFKEGELPFFFKGGAGGWREHFDAEMTAKAQQWIADNLRGCDLRFPHWENEQYE